MESYGFGSDPLCKNSYLDLPLGDTGRYENERNVRTDLHPAEGEWYFTPDWESQVPRPGFLAGTSYPHIPLQDNIGYENDPILSTGWHWDPAEVPRRFDRRSSEEAYHAQSTSNPEGQNRFQMMPCQFSKDGCWTTLKSMEDCRRHVRTYHVKPGFWLRKGCQDSAGKYESFHRIDIHESIEKDWSQLKLRDTPLQSSCFVCDDEFSGSDSWGKRMDHIAEHLLWIRVGPRIENPQEWYDDPELRDWLLKKSMIDSDARVGWRIGDALPPHSSASESTSPMEDHATRDKATTSNQIVQQSLNFDHNEVAEAEHPTGTLPIPSIEPCLNDSSLPDARLTESTFSLPIRQNNVDILGAAPSGNRLSSADCFTNLTQSTMLGGIAVAGDVLQSATHDFLSPAFSSVGSNFEDSINSFDSDIDDFSEETEYSDEESSDSVSSRSRNTALSVVLREFRRDILMQLFSKFPGNPNSYAFVTSYPAESSHSSTYQRRNSSQSSPSNSNSGQPSDSRGRSKGRRNSDDANGDDENENNDSERGSKSSQSPASTRTKVWTRLACPYFKHEPERHQKWPSCKGPGWVTVHRVK